MKILLIYPPQSSEAFIPENFEPLALEILASTIFDHETRILDLRFESLSRLSQLLALDTPDVVGISVNNTIQVNQSLRILKYIKKANPKIKNIVGGHHPTLTPEDFYIPSVDAIFLGWAEKSFPKYIALLESGEEDELIPGVISLKNGIPICQNKNPHQLDSYDIPLPNRSLTKQYWKKYRNAIGQKTVLVNTTRGCPYRCIFCACWKAAGGYYLVRKAKHVFEELMSLPSDVYRVFFADDNTFFDTKRAEELCDLIKKSKIRKQYSGYCRSDTIVKHPDLFSNWKEIGLDNLTIGFEAVENNKLKELKKANRIEINQQAIQILNDFHINFSSYFLIDPEFEKEDFKNISNYVDRLNLIRPRFVILTPLPGTELYEMKKNKINLSYDFFDFMHWIVPTKIKALEFYRNFARLYYKAYSYKRHIKILLNNFSRVLNNFKSKHNKLKHLPIIELILLRIMAFPIRRKLYKQYFKIKN